MFIRESVVHLKEFSERAAPALIDALAMNVMLIQHCRGIWMSQQLRVVIKMMRGSRADLERECAFLQSLSHPRVLPLLGVCATDGERQMLVVQWMEHQSLGYYTQAAREQNVVTSMVRRVRWCLECAEGVAYLHAQQPPIAYRCVRLSNFLLDADLHVKIGRSGSDTQLWREARRCMRRGVVCTAAV
jgi:hypothetical protein